MHFRQFGKKNETNFTILCMVHYSSMLVIENSPIIKNKKPMAKYVMYILTTHSPILLTDKNFFFIKVHFCAFFNPYMDVKLGM